MPAAFQHTCQHVDAVLVFALSYVCMRALERRCMQLEHGRGLACQCTSQHACSHIWPGKLDMGRAARPQGSSTALPCQAPATATSRIWARPLLYQNRCSTTWPAWPTGMLPEDVKDFPSPLWLPLVEHSGCRLWSTCCPWSGHWLSSFHPWASMQLGTHYRGWGHHGSPSLAATLMSHRTMAPTGVALWPRPARAPH